MKINQIAESATREKWALAEKILEEKQLFQFETQLNEIGENMTSVKIAQCVTEHLIRDDATFAKLIKSAWDECNFRLPDSKNDWDLPVDVDGTRFLNTFISMFNQKVEFIFSSTPLKLRRFENFKIELLTTFKQKISDRTPLFLKRWLQITRMLSLAEDTITINPHSYLRGIKRCTITMILMNLTETPAGPMTTLENQLLSLMSELSNQESTIVQNERMMLQTKIDALKNVLTMLPGQNQKEEIRAIIEKVTS